MKRFITYLNERSPLPALTFLSAGIAASPMAINQSFNWPIFVLGIIVNNFLFIQMRLGDELKDFDTDKIINPTRPLPRGLFSPEEVLKLLKIFLCLLVWAGLLISIFLSPIGGFALILASVFSWLMFKEFYISHTLDKSPMLYALTHQVIVFPLFAWPALTANPSFIENKTFLGWLIANFGASFTFEICRKLNPSAHELAKTYAHHYGRPSTIFYCLIFMLVSAFGAYMAGFSTVSWSALALLLISLIIWNSKPDQYKIPAALSALSSAIILWSPCVQYLMTIWSQK